MIVFIVAFAAINALNTLMLDSDWNATYENMFLYSSGFIITTIVNDHKTQRKYYYRILGIKPAAYLLAMSLSHYLFFVLMAFL